MDWGLFPVGDWLWVSRGLSFLGEDLKTPAVYFPRRTATELLFNNFPRPVSLFRVQDMSPNWSCGQVSKLQAGIVYIPARRSYASFDSSFSTSALDRGSGSPSIVGLPDCPLPWSLAPPNRLSWLLPRTEPKSGNGTGRSAVDRSLNIGRPARRRRISVNNAGNEDILSSARARCPRSQAVAPMASLAGREGFQPSTRTGCPRSQHVFLARPRAGPAAFVRSRCPCSR